VVWLFGLKCALLKNKIFKSIIDLSLLNRNSVFVPNNLSFSGIATNSTTFGAVLKITAQNQRLFFFYFNMLQAVSAPF
jgi:hypothetical protein